MKRKKELYPTLNKILKEQKEESIEQELIKLNESRQIKFKHIQQLEIDYNKAVENANFPKE